MWFYCIFFTLLVIKQISNFYILVFKQISFRYVRKTKWRVYKNCTCGHISAGAKTYSLYLLCLVTTIKIIYAFYVWKYLPLSRSVPAHIFSPKLLLFDDWLNNISVIKTSSQTFSVVANNLYDFIETRYNSRFFYVL